MIVAIELANGAKARRFSVLTGKPYLQWQTRYSIWVARAPLQRWDRG